MFSGATSVTDWDIFFSATNLLLGYRLEQSDTGKSLCSFKDKGDSIEVTKLYTATSAQNKIISIAFVLSFSTVFK